MSISAGQTLGKYELIEKVGQGGMAVVYRGFDSSLKREVAVKVLHSHLADNEEARARFGREAHAVAKLRHENILEIHDFSGVGSNENYIVTEFIEGCTLREFTADHAIHFPEIGAMITVQVCRALAHAHGLGVLHRDVKPENIMIRSDGIVKLTDFGISQMVDMQRMTVTGQLLGSPAYMSPEHVRGGQLDFRTDVFAVGIVLYQLVTGDMPFQGKNPHEILKRIADCVYPDPSRVNPRVGKELANIINTALAAEPDDRYADISLMQQALDEYIEGSGLSASREELERFFTAPAAYQMALEKRLVDYLCERGQSLQASKGVGALECFNRVLSIDKNNTLVLALLRKEECKQRNRKIAIALGGLALLAGLSVIAQKRFSKIPDDSVVESNDAGLPIALVPRLDAAVPSLDATAVLTATTLFDAGTIADAKPTKAVVIRKRNTDAGSLTKPALTRSYTLSLSPRSSEYRIDDGPWKPSLSGQETLRLPLNAKTLSARNPDCCQERRIPIARDGTRGRINLPYLPAQITPKCDLPGVKVKLNGKNARIGRGATIPITRLTGTEVVTIEFIADARVDSHKITVAARASETVTCKF